jgi:hypothetical protein
MTPKQEVHSMEVDYVHLGGMLRESRESLQWDVDYVSQALRIRGDWVKALELGDFSVFPGKVYAKGFLANYARLMGVEQLLDNPPMKEHGATHPIPAPSHYSASTHHAVKQAATARSVYKASSGSSSGYPLPQTAFGKASGAMNALTPARATNPSQLARAKNSLFSVNSMLVSACIAVLVFFVAWTVQQRVDTPAPNVSEVQNVPQQMENYLQTGLVGESGLDMGTLDQPAPVASCVTLSEAVNWPPCYDRATMLKQQEGLSLMRLTHPLAVMLGK